MFSTSFLVVALSPGNLTIVVSAVVRVDVLRDTEAFEFDKIWPLRDMRGAEERDVSIGGDGNGRMSNSHDGTLCGRSP